MSAGRAVARLLKTTTAVPGTYRSGSGAKWKPQAGLRPPGAWLKVHVFLHGSCACRADSRPGLSVAVLFKSSLAPPDCPTYGSWALSPLLFGAAPLPPGWPRRPALGPASGVGRLESPGAGSMVRRSSGSRLKAAWVRLRGIAAAPPAAPAALGLPRGSRPAVAGHLDGGRLPA